MARHWQSLGVCSCKQMRFGSTYARARISCVINESHSSRGRLNLPSGDHQVADAIKGCLTAAVDPAW